MYSFIQSGFITFISVLIFNLTGCGENSKSKNPEEKENAAIPIEVSVVEKGKISAVFSGTANLEAEEEATVVAKVAGLVKSIFVEEGDFVKKGQVLAKLDDEKPLFKLNQARANLNKSKNEMERNEKLFRQNLISAEAFDKIKYECESIKATFDLARLEVNYTSIKAPINGVVSTRFIKEGNMININDPTFHITDFDPLNAVLYVPERHMNKLEKEQSVDFTVDAITDLMFTGSIKRISPVVDPNSGTIKVTVEVDDPQGKLKPGMFGRVNIIYDTHEKTLLVPKEAVLIEDRESSVFVVRDTLAFRQIVFSGYVNVTHMEIVSGLNAGDTIVTIGQSSLKDSSKILIINGEIASKNN